MVISHVGYHHPGLNVEIKSHEAINVNISMPVDNVQLSDLVVTAGTLSTINTLTPLDIKLRPTNTSQDILRMVPGLFIAQHAGGGKAEQIFLRGFDIDHGTDLSLEVDGMPVNMVSHAHGQGYADLHFVIPEFINYVDFDKGPYFANKGDFTTAGYVDFQTKNVLEENFVKLEGGRFNTWRSVAGVNLFSPNTERTKGYIGGEFFFTDGFVESPQDFKRVNLTTKISTLLKNEDQITIGGSYFTSSWDASGQIPSRAIANGMITRYGSIDDTEGGNTSRGNLFVKHGHRFNNQARITSQAYAVYYDFDLYSNFTFYLNDPVNGDQIRQREQRMIYGFKSQYSVSGTLSGKDLITEVGGGFRIDDVNDVALSRTRLRSFLSDEQKGDVNEANINFFVNETIMISDSWSATAGLRFDHLAIKYKDALQGTIQAASQSIVNPKLHINYHPNHSSHFFVRAGTGFHSNDARVIMTERGRQILPRAYGVDVGMNKKINDKLFVHAALWGLDLEQEFVYVGDEGIVEAGGKTRRAGIDLSMRYEILPWLFLDTDLNVTRPKAKEEPEGSDYIPLAPTLSSIGGLSFNLKNGLNGTLRYRYIADRAANEDNSVIAKGYFITDAVLNYSRERYEFGITVENIFDRPWNEAQFDTESRLLNEVDPVSEIHFTPGTPFFFKLKACFYF